MNTQPPEWSRLVAAARRAPRDTRDEAAPYGFATRVATHAHAVHRKAVQFELHAGGLGQRGKQRCPRAFAFRARRSAKYQTMPLDPAATSGRIAATLAR